MKPVVIDTNVLLEFDNIFDVYNDIILCSSILEELDGLKKSEVLGYKARRAIRNIESNIDSIKFVIKDKYDNMPNDWEYKRDNNIVLCALENNAKLVTNDINLRLKALSIGVEPIKHEYILDDVDYRGYKEVALNHHDQAQFYESMDNKWDLLENQYLIIRDEATNEVIDKLKWTNKGFANITNKSLKSIYFGDIKAKDVYQMCAIDSLINSDFTLLFGMAGSAKTLLSLAWIMQNIANNKIGKAVIIFPVAKLRNNQKLGFYGGNRTEKLLQESLGGILSSKLGDMNMVDTLINQGKLLLIPTSDIRGIEISEHDCLFVTEAQNTDSYTMRTILQRAKEGCKIIVEGDMLEQTDIGIDLNSNGMIRAIEAFKGTKYFSCMQLQTAYRSPIAQIASQI